MVSVQLLSMHTEKYLNETDLLSDVPVEVTNEQMESDITTDSIFQSNNALNGNPGIQYFSPLVGNLNA